MSEPLREPSLKAVDITIEKRESCRVAYYRITPDFLEFLKKCNKKYGIFGFEYDGTLNLGVIFKAKNKD